MWRIGHDYHQKKSEKPKISTKPRRSRDAPQTEPARTKPAFKPILKLGDEPRSLTSRRRSSNFSADYAATQRSSGAGGKNIPEEVSQYLKERRLSNRPNHARGLTKVKEIQERINRVISYYDDAPITGEDSNVEDMLQAVEEGLGNIQDDMLRINISQLVGQHRILKRMEEDRRQEVRDFADNYLENHETLSALQSWLDRDHMDDVDSAEFEQTMREEFDKEVVHKELANIKSKMHKLIELKQRIRRLKTTGDNTYHLERQRENLHEQMKSEVKRLKSKNESAATEQTGEYDYLKNATKEVYQLIQKTKLEGMAQANQYELQLKKILKEMDDSKSEIKSLQELVSSQREQIAKWSKDYDKLHNELMITADERNMSRDDGRILRSELMQLKQKFYNPDVKPTAEDTIPKSQHDEIVDKLHKALKLAKQNLIVVSRTLEEKERYKTDLAQQCNRLKASLRKASNASNMSFTSDSGYQSSTSDLGNARSIPTNTSSLDFLKVYNSSTESLVNPNTELIYGLKRELDQMRWKVDELQRENLRIKEKLQEHSEENSETAAASLRTSRTSTSRSYTSSVSKISDHTLECHNKETQTIPMTASPTKSHVRIGDGPTPPIIITESVACQTTPPAHLPYMTPTEQVQMSDACRTLADKMGDRWLDTAKQISSLQSEDFEEINKGLAIENEYRKMYSGTTGDADSGASPGKPKLETIAERMLRGDSPSTIQTHFREQERNVREKVEDMKKKVASYVSDIKKAVNNHAGVMNVVNDEIRNIVDHETRTKTMEVTDEDISQFIAQTLSRAPTATQQNPEISIDMPPELNELHSLEQANRKMELIEKTLCNLITETKDIYSSEVQKENQTYANLHSTTHIQMTSQYPVTGPNVERKVDQIREKVRHKVSETNAKVMHKSKARVILRSLTHNSTTKFDTSQPGQEQSFDFHKPSPAPSNYGIRGYRRAPSVNTFRPDQKRSQQNVAPGKFWQHGGQVSNHALNTPGREPKKLKQAEQLAPINEEPRTFAPDNSRKMSALTERYGHGIGFSRRNHFLRNQNTSNSNSSKELGLIIQSSPLKKSMASLPTGHKKTPSFWKDRTPLYNNRNDHFSRNGFPHIFTQENRRPQGGFRSGGLASLVDFRIQNFKPYGQGGGRDDLKFTANGFGSSKLPFIKK